MQTYMWVSQSLLDAPLQAYRWVGWSLLDAPLQAYRWITTSHTTTGIQVSHYLTHHRRIRIRSQSNLLLVCSMNERFGWDPMKGSHESRSTHLLGFVFILWYLYEYISIEIIYFYLTYCELFRYGEVIEASSQQVICCTTRVHSGDTTWPKHTQHGDHKPFLKSCILKIGHMCEKDNHCLTQVSVLPTAWVSTTPDWHFWLGLIFQLWGYFWLVGWCIAHGVFILLAQRI